MSKSFDSSSKNSFERIFDGSEHFLKTEMSLEAEKGFNTKKWFSTRFSVAYMGFWAFFLAYASRIVLSVAMNDLVETSTEPSSNESVNENCPAPAQTTNTSNLNVQGEQMTEYNC